MDEKQKEKLIEEEYQRLSSLFSAADSNERAVLDPLLRNAAFMSVTLGILQKTINEEGAVEHYQNGQFQTGQKPSAALQSYNALSKSYATVSKTLRAYLPPAGSVSALEVRECEKYKKEAEEYKEAYREISLEYQELQIKLLRIWEKYNIEEAKFSQN